MSVASTYAEALFEAAQAQSAVDQVRTELAEFSAAMADGTELHAALTNPQFETTAKRAAVGEIMEGAHPVSSGFVQVLIDRGRLGEIDDVLAAYGRRVDTAEGRVVVAAVTAVPLTPELRDQIREKVRAQTGRDAEIEETVDPSIIGGLVLRVGDVVVDASLRTRLEEMRRSLETTPVDLSKAVEA
ncbi:MAG: ATP synthase F1 subunit delta [Thermoleophilia bacterium]|jgi:F-type H+-transporting ATPase subunit delta|nr:ATP synthase F1 subunit delta [Thermoleophilia bacterium]